jgi:hypothetical protein
MTAFASLTLVLFTIALPLAAWVLLKRNAEHPLGSFLLQPYKGERRGLWVVPLRFGRKLWFAALTSAWDFSDPTTSGQLALAVFISLLIMLSVQLRLRPYADPRDNSLEVSCLLLLAYGYFVSVLPGATVAMDVSVGALQVVLLGYAVHRWGRQQLAVWSSRLERFNSLRSVELSRRLTSSDDSDVLSLAGSSVGPGQLDEALLPRDSETQRESDARPL